MSEPNVTDQDLPSTFSQLVIMLATSALQQLGQISDPSGQPPAVSLEGAQSIIDLLEMLEAKTTGNLDTAESKMLRESLTMLRLQYVEVKQAAGNHPPAQPDVQPAAPNDPVAPPEPQSNAATDESQSKTKFRKSYG